MEIPGKVIVDVYLHLTHEMIVMTVLANQMAVLTWIIVMNVLVEQLAMKHVCRIVMEPGVAA